LASNLSDFFKKVKNKKILTRYIFIAKMYGLYYLRSRNKTTGKCEILGKFLTKDEARAKLNEVKKQDYEHSSIPRD
jgi:hypothetical protein